jgi:C_GCAxxG_C_C family probable redox protein
MRATERAGSPMNRPEQAETLFRQGFACSQAVLASYAGDHGLGVEHALRVGEGFAAGLCGLGRTCGAVTGAIMVIGLKHGRARADDLAARESTSARVRRFVTEFERRHGSSECRELLGCEIDTPDKRQAAREAGLFARVCPPLVRSAAEILEDVLS